MATAHVADVAKLLRLVTNVVPLATVPVTVPMPQASGDDYRRALRQQVNRAVARMSSDRNLPHNHIHGDLNRHFGDTLPTASVETLQKRLGVLREWQ